MSNLLAPIDPNAALQALVQVVSNATADPVLQAAAQAPLAALSAAISQQQQQLAALQAQVRTAQQAQATAQAQAIQAQSAPSVTPQQAAIVSLGTMAIGGLAGWGLTAWLESRKHKKLAAHEARERPRASEDEEDEPAPLRRRRNR